MTTLVQEKLRFGKFHHMAQVIPEGKAGDCEVRHFTIKDKPNFRWAAHPEERIAPGTYAQLLVRGDLMMSDTDMELHTNREAVDAARGDVLIAGLGLGVITLPILQKASVHSVTVVEKSPHVVQLVEEPLRRAITGNQSAGFLIWTQEIQSWRPRPENINKFDFIYFDIWPVLCVDHVEEMKRLHLVFRPFLKKGGTLTSWEYDHLRSLKRQGRWR